MSNLETLSKAYLEYFRSNDNVYRAEHFDDWVQVDDWIRNKNPEQGMNLILALLKLAESKEEITYIASGPLEDFMNKHGKDIEIMLEEKARLFPKMREAICYVWTSEGSPSQKVREKILKNIP